MKHLKLFEKFIWDYQKRDYYFESSDWEYRVSVKENIFNSKYPYIGFRAKKEDWPFYDMDILTNDNIYEVGETIMDIIDKDIQKYKNDGYTFSFSGDSKKSKQKLELYKRWFKNNWELSFDNKNNHYLVKKLS